MAEPVTEFFSYDVEFLAIAGSASNQAQTFTVDSDADFIMARTMADLRSASTGTYVAPEQAPFTFTWQNITKNKTYMNIAVPLPNQYGTAQRPFLLTAMLRIPAKSVFQVTVTNLSATQYWLRLTHSGYREWPAAYFA